MTGLRLVFMGSPDFAVPTLSAMLEAGHEVRCVYAQPPRPAGRGHREQPTAVHAFAETAGLPVRTPRSLRGPEEQAAFAALGTDAAVVAAYGLILPKPILEAPRLGCFNVHASLLPRWRGAAPIQRAILAGDAETGITIMQMDEGLDTGPILLDRRVPIEPSTTAAQLHARLAAVGGELMTAALEGLAGGALRPSPQPSEGATYAAKVERSEGRLNWRETAAHLERQVRAFDPWPGAWFEHREERVKVLSAEVVAVSGEAGTVLDDRLTVACGEAALRPLKVQRPGRGPTDTPAALRGYPIPAGTVLP